MHLAGYRAVKLLLGAISSNLAGVVQPFWRAFSTPVPKRFSSRSPFAAGMAGADTATLAGPSRSNLTHRSQLDCSFLTPAHIHHSTTAKHFDVYRFKGIIGLCFNPSYFLFNILRQRCSIQSPSIPYHRSVPSRPTGCPRLILFTFGHSILEDHPSPLAALGWDEVDHTPSRGLITQS